MAIRPAEFDSVAAWLEPVLKGLPPKLIAITGPMGAGKTTLARFLAWYFNITLIETDHYLVPHNGLQCDPTEVNRIIAHRVAVRRPVLVEGTSVLRLLAEISRMPDGIVQVRNLSDDRRIGQTEMQLLDPTKWGQGNCALYEMTVSHDG